MNTGDSMIFENSLITVEHEPSEIPWVKVFTKRNIKEFSHCSSEEKAEIFRVIDITEKLMLSYFNENKKGLRSSSQQNIITSPICKINIASFGNILPRVHWHIMARFENDSYFPEPMWGKKQRDSSLVLPSIEVFYQKLGKEL